MDVPEGETTLRYELEPTRPPDIREGLGAPGRGQLYINGELVGNTEFPTTVPITFGIEGLSCGYDFGEGRDAVDPDLYHNAPGFLARTFNAEFYT